MNKALPGVVLLAFGGLTVAAVLQHGYVGIFQYESLLTRGEVPVEGLDRTRYAAKSEHL